MRVDLGFMLAVTLCVILGHAVYDLLRAVL